MKKQRTCKNCVLPETTLVSIESNERCKLCNSPDLFKHILKEPDNEKLSEIIERIRRNGKGKAFDCVVAWSGGRDSTFMLYELVTKHNLRCVAVFGKTPFTPIEIVENVHSISRQLGIKLIEIQTPSNHQRIAGYCLKEYIKTGSPLFINLACSPCKFVNRELFKQARKLGVKAVVFGGNRFEYFPSGPASIDLNDENRYSLRVMIKDNMLRLLKGGSFLSRNPSLLKHLSTFFKASILYVNQYTVFLRLFYPGIYRFDFYHYADWDEGLIQKTLQFLGWKLPKGCNSTWRADCVFEAVKNTAFEERLGFTYAHVLYSNLIRAGKLTRNTAIQRLENEGVSESRLNEALKLCGLPENALNSEGHF
jgi:predicted PP-loop superfamily ATPase